MLPGSHAGASDRSWGVPGGQRMALFMLQPLFVLDGFIVRVAQGISSLGTPSALCIDCDITILPEDPGKEARVFWARVPDAGFVPAGRQGG